MSNGSGVSKLTFSMGILHLLTSPACYFYPTSAKDLKRGLKRISAKVWTLAGYQPREINNINTNKNNYGSIDM